LLPDDVKAVIYSVKGCALSDDERSFFQKASPLGFILFARNCETHAQLMKLVEDLRCCVGWHCPVLIDQEGGRVQRLKPPVWRGYPSMQSFGARYESDEQGTLEDLRHIILQLSSELVECGINVNCAPVLDVLIPESHDVIGDRAFSDKEDIVSRLGLSACRYFIKAGIVPVIKHIPGHGRALVDSHKDLPVVDASYEELERVDFEPFRFMAESDVSQSIWAMASHVVYNAIDPKHPASVSHKVIEDVIRAKIGFDGFLLSDDLDMQALEEYGDVAERTVRTLEAGCDAALYCAGDLEIMKKLQKSVPNLTEKARKRLQNSYKIA
tara:strand:+ start:417 stop:1391 length:975 start_codon:yes stop_codon:yes gene_type:complete